MLHLLVLRLQRVPPHPTFQCSRDGAPVLTLMQQALYTLSWSSGPVYHVLYQWPMLVYSVALRSPGLESLLG